MHCRRRHAVRTGEQTRLARRACTQVHACVRARLCVKHRAIASFMVALAGSLAPVRRQHTYAQRWDGSVSS